MKKVVYVPLDERPCNYSLCGLIAADNEDINLVEPNKEDLGDKKIPADYDK